LQEKAKDSKKRKSVPSEKAGGDRTKKTKGGDKKDTPEGDEYHSDGDVAATKDDEDFIEEDSDDELGLKEAYGGKQDFGDDRPEGYEQRRHRDDEEEMQARKVDKNIAPEDMNPIDLALKKIQNGKSKIKSATSSLDTQGQEDFVKETLAKMDEAVDEDEELRKQKLPAINKTKLLPQLLNILRKKKLHIVFLDFNLLACLTKWIKPFPDNSLPSINVRTALYKVLAELPVDRDHLKESGMGKVVMGLWQHKKETKENK
jgi:transcription factor SPN1